MSNVQDYKVPQVDEIILKDEMKKMQGMYQQEAKRVMALEYDLTNEKDILNAVTHFVTKKFKAKVVLIM